MSVKKVFCSAVLVFAAAVGILGQGLPAPTEDRVLFPTGYRDTFTKLLTVDRSDNGQIRAIWGNDIATSTPWWLPYPYGSVLLFESYTSKRDSAGNLMLDENGRLIPDTLTTIFVKRKEEGFGEAYRDIRNGEWEYVAYRPDGSTATPPANSGSCAQCHLQAGPPRDFTFRRQSFLGKGTGAIPLATISLYSFIPRNLTVKKGTVVTWYNDDYIEHQIFSNDLGVNSNVLGHGESYAITFDRTGQFEIRCNIHAGMRATVTVQ